MRILSGLLLLAASSAAAQQPSRFEFSIANIMRGPEVYGREPQQVRWMPDGRWLYFMWNEPGTDWREPLRPYRVRPVAGARPERVTDAHMDSVGPLAQPGRLSPSKTNWELAVYPVEDHAFIRPSSWTDEYRRIFELFERHLAPPEPRVQSSGGGGPRR